MANVFAVHSVCSSIASFLQGSYPASLAELAMPPCHFEVMASGHPESPQADANRIGLYLYRTTFSALGRQSRPVREPSAGPAPLSLDLHILVSSWSRRALDEQVMFAWTLRQLDQHPVFDVSSLTAEAGWAAEDQIQIVPAELSNEDTLGIWRALGVPYRLCAPYIARVVRLDADASPDALPVVQGR